MARIVKRGFKEVRTKLRNMERAVEGPAAHAAMGLAGEALKRSAQEVLRSRGSWHTGSLGDSIEVKVE